MGFLFCLFLTVVAAVSLIVVPIGRAGAHSELRETSPGSDQAVGGQVDRIELAFLSLVLPDGASLLVTGPDGEEVPPTGPLEVDGVLVVLPITPLTDPGQYTVRYTLMSEDGDVVRDGYEFTYDAAAPEPTPVVGSLANHDSPNSIARVLALGSMAFFAFAVLYAVFSPKLRRRGKAGD